MNQVVQDFAIHLNGKHVSGPCSCAIIFHDRGEKPKRIFLLQGSNHEEFVNEPPSTTEKKQQWNSCSDRIKLSFAVAFKPDNSRPPYFVGHMFPIHAVIFLVLQDFLFFHGQEMYVANPTDTISEISKTCLLNFWKRLKRFSFFSHFFVFFHHFCVIKTGVTVDIKCFFHLHCSWTYLPELKIKINWLRNQIRTCARYSSGTPPETKFLIFFFGIASTWMWIRYFHKGELLVNFVSFHDDNIIALLFTCLSIKPWYEDQ